MNKECGVEGVFADDFELHFVLFPAEEVDAGLVFPLEPLEEIAATLEDAKAPSYTGIEPKGIIENRAISAVFCGVEKFKNRLEEFCVND